MAFKYDNPVAEFNVGDTVRVGSGKTDWIVKDKGATSGLSLENATGRKRYVQSFEVSLVRRSGEQERHQ